MTESTDQQGKTEDFAQDKLQDSLVNNTSEGIDWSESKPIPFQELSIHYPKLNAFSSFISWAIILLIMLIIDIFVAKINLHFAVLPGLLILSILSGVFGYFSANACGYYPDEFDIYFKQGLWWRKQVALNYSRIQHIDISHGPLERKYNMATIKFFTAGGASSDLRISGLPNKEAEQLRTDILRYAKENVITDELPDTEQNSELLDTTIGQEAPEIVGIPRENNHSNADSKND